MRLPLFYSLSCGYASASAYLSTVPRVVLSSIARHLHLDLVLRSSLADPRPHILRSSSLSLRTRFLHLPLSTVPEQRGIHLEGRRRTRLCLTLHDIAALASAFRLPGSFWCVPSKSGGCHPTSLVHILSPSRRSVPVLSVLHIGATSPASQMWHLLSPAVASAPRHLRRCIDDLETEWRREGTL
jgi:hypothetical protein